MNRNQLILLLIGVAVIGGVSLGVFKKNASSWQQGSSTPAKVLKEFAINSVAQIEIKTTQADLHLVKKEGHWVVKERGDFPASFERVRDFVRKLWELKPVQSVKVGPSQLGRLELVEPAPNAKSAGTVVDLMDEKGARIRAVLLGKQCLREGGGMQGMGGMDGYPAGRYVMALDSESEPFLVGDALSQADASAPQWLDREFFKIERIKSVAITGTSPEVSWSLVRETETDNWKLADAKSGEELDQAKVPIFASQLGFPSFVDVVMEKNPEGLENATAISVETFDGFRYCLTLGSAQSPENYLLTVAVSANLPKERTPGKDEKPEDKKRLDTQFADKNKALLAKLDKEIKLQGEVFLVSKGAFDSLLKKRSELLAEKESAPSPSPAPAASSASAGQGKIAPAQGTQSIPARGAKKK